MRLRPEGRQLVGILLEARRTEDAGKAPFASAERADEEAAGPLHLGSIAAQADPGRAAAERAAPASMDAVGSDTPQAERLDVRAQDRAREVVPVVRPIFGPVEKEPRSRGRRRVVPPG